MPNPLFGVVLHSIGGLAAGSFYIPFRKVRLWSWESYWLIQGIAAWIVTPWLAAVLTVPNLLEVLADSPVKSLAWAYLFGALWGIGGLTFGLSMRYLGMSLGYAVALGCCAAFGFLIPPAFDGKLLEMFGDDSGRAILAGVGVCLGGIGVCGFAGVCKERELTEEQKKQSVKEFSLVKGFAVALFAGEMSACMALAIRAGEPIGEVAVAAGVDEIYKKTPAFIVIMAGGFTTNVLWCLILNFKNRTIGDYVTGSPRSLAANYALSSLAGVIWYGQFFFYGMGTTQMGKYDFSSWTIHMAFIIVFSNLWGLFFREWKGVSRRTLIAVWSGILVLVLSTVVIGWGNYLGG
ncbi:MAG: L-rhamnose/proton symporter RhaT [Pirellulales bacterium]|nr:L-rhamnose/proton symporter RhaT [Pirellulales bacterium]